MEAHQLFSTPSLSPMLLHYQACKAEHPDCFLFYQVGDFYELFFDDAREVSRILNLTLTSRDKNAEDPIPMCGVPLRAAETYIARLVDQGFSVAVVDQASDSSGKGVSRALSRIVTPGIRLMGSEEVSSSPTSGGTLAALILRESGEWDYAVSRVTSGVVQVRDVLSFENVLNALRSDGVIEALMTSASGEGVLDARHAGVRTVRSIVGTNATKVVSRALYERVPQQLLEINGMRLCNPYQRRVAALLIGHVGLSHGSAPSVFHLVKPYEHSSVVLLDSSTRANLELLSQGTSSLFGVLNDTVTQGGRQLLHEWLMNPSNVRETIINRQDAVRFFFASGEVRREVRTLLSLTPSLERIGARLAMGVVTPRELASLRDFLLRRFQVVSWLQAHGESEVLPSHLRSLCERLKVDLPYEFSAALTTLADTPPHGLSEGGIFCQGSSVELDSLRALASGGTELLAALEQKERIASGISSLKIKANGIIGYFFECPRSFQERIPPHFIAKQSTSTTLRFVTSELSSLEREVVTAQGKVVEYEKERFLALRSVIACHRDIVRDLSDVTHEIDVLCTFAETGNRYRYTFPEIIEDEGIIDISDGRHPVVERILRESFVPNSLLCGGATASCIIITGPNMGGKSTFLRQAGLLTLLAHTGSMVPADKMRVSICDRIYARIGANDNLSEGESTFMVEMREVSSILACATPRSLVLIDELGRGTSSQDGLALAETIVEWIIEKVRCRLLCATHFHELGDVEDKYGSACALNLRVASETVEWSHGDNNVVFSHSIERGRAKYSYGIDVAKSAGLPDDLIRKARKRLTELHSSPSRKGKKPSLETLPLFSPRVQIQNERSTDSIGASCSSDAVRAPRVECEESSEKSSSKLSQSRASESEVRVLSRLRAHDFTATTPLDALTLLFSLQSELKVEEDTTFPPLDAA
jgi:DNA mismatch repair protein MutS